MPARRRSALALGVVADRLADHDLRLVQHDGAFGHALLADEAADEEGQLVRAVHGAGADEGAELGHLGDDHGDDLEGVDLVVGIVARLAVLHHEDAEDLAEALDRHAEEAREALLAGLGQVAVAAGVRGVGGGERLGGLGDLADEALADAEAGEVHRLRVEPLGGGELEHVLAAEVDRADLGDEALGDQADDAVEPFLAAAGLGQRGAQAREEHAAVDGIRIGHRRGQSFGG